MLQLVNLHKGNLGFPLYYSFKFSVDLEFFKLKWKAFIKNLKMVELTGYYKPGNCKCKILRIL